MVFLSNYLVFKIVAAAVTGGRIAYPDVADLVLKYDSANKLFLSGGALNHVRDITLFKDGVSYELSESLNLDISNEKILLADDRDTNTQLGYDAAISGDYIIGGAPQDDEAASEAGAAYIFKRTGTTWAQTAKLMASDAASSDQFGEFCDISGDYAIVGLYTKSSSAGAAYVFKRDTGAETWTQQEKITASDTAASDNFGNGVKISSDYAIVGSPYNDDTASNSGSAYIFIRSGTDWTEQQKIVASDAASNDEFGLSVDISGDYVISGANSGTQRPGSAYVFKRSGTSWSQQAKLQASDGATGDRFGKAVALSGDYAVIGAYNDTSGAGSAYIFKKDTGAETWTQQQKLTASDAASNDYFGYKVEISGDTAIIGAYYADPGGVSGAGAAYVFKRTGETWTEVKKLTASTHATTDGRFGEGLGVSGNTILVSAGYNDVDGVTHAGALYVYNSQRVTNYYINKTGKYSADLKICGLDYKTNELDITSLTIPAKVVQVSTSSIHSLALTQDGFVYAWGKGQFGRLGQGSSDVADKNTPVKVKGVGGIGYLSNITKIAAGGYHNIVLASDGKMYTWGYNGYGNLGDGTQTQRETPVEVSYSGDAVSNISCGFAHTAFTTTTGKVYCFGHGLNGQIGNNATNTNTLNPTQVVGVGNSGTLAGIRDVTCGDSFTHAIKESDGSVYGWGKKTYGMLGNGESSGNQTTPVSVILAGGSAVTGITQISGGGDYALMLKSDGTVYACGYGANGQLGDGSTDNNDTGLVQVHKTWQGPSIIYCTSTSDTPASQASGYTFKRYATADIDDYIVYALNDTGNQYNDHLIAWRISTETWVDGDDTSIGDGTAGDQEPVTVNTWSGNSNYIENTYASGVKFYFLHDSSWFTHLKITQIAAAESTSLALKNDGTMYSWGNNADGQNGLGTVGGTNPTTPVAITLLTGVDTINADAKPMHFIASKPDGSVFCWGQGDSGQIGDGTNTADQGTPTQVLAGAGPSIGGKFNLFTEPRLSFDNYNKLSLLHGLSSLSSRLNYGSNVYDIGTLTSNVIISKSGEYVNLTSDTGSNVAYFSNVTVTVASTQKDFALDNTLYGTVQSGHTHGNSQGGFGNNTILNADGTRLLVTDPLNYSSGRGRAYIYHLESGSWVLKQTWDNPNNSGQRFSDGACMNEDGTRVFLMHSESEKVYTYEYASGAWPTANTGTHTISPGTIGSLCLNLSCNKTGDVLLIVHGRSQTSKIYRRASATSWSQDSGGSFSSMGDGGCINGDGTRAFLGRESDSTIHMTEWNGSTWSALSEIIDESDTTFPAAMACDSAGDTLVVKASTLADIDKSGIYERDSGTGSWSRVQGINGSTEIYGTTQPSISYDGTMVLVGSHHYDSSKGRAYLWQKSGGSWSLTETYDNPDASPAANDYWGSGTGIARTSKGTFVIGFQSDDTDGTDYGSVWTYTNAIPKYLDFDTYNKLSISSITPISSTLKYFSNTYDIGTASNIYIDSAGTYDAEITASDKFALVSNVVGSLTANPLENYRSATIPSAYLDYGSSSDRQVTICFWYKHTTDQPGHHADARGPVRLGTTTTASGAQCAFGVLGTFADGTNRMRGYTGMSNNSVYTYWDNLPSGFDETKWNFYIFRYMGNGNNHQMYLPEFDYSDNGSGNYGQSWRYVVFNLPDDHGSSLTDFSVYEGNKATTESWRTTLYNNGQIGGAANETTDRLHYLRFHKDTIGDDIGSKNTDISSGSITPSMSLPGYSAAPSLTFDGYNKYTFTSADTDSTYKLKYLSNTYDLGTISNVYIENPGTYSAEIKGETNFALSSNVTGAISTPPPGTNGYTFSDFQTEQRGESNDNIITFEKTSECTSTVGYWNTSDLHAHSGHTCIKWDSSVTYDAANNYGWSLVAGGCESGVTLTISSGQMKYHVPAPWNHYFDFDSGRIAILSPSLTFDGFNKYTFANVDTGSTYKLKYLSNTYDLGTASNVYIANPGTYSAEIKSATNFVLTSNAATYNNVPRYVNTNTYSYTGSDQTISVPSGVTHVKVVLKGAGGGHGYDSYSYAIGGTGGYTEAEIELPSGTTSLTLIVGQGGDSTVNTSKTYGGGGGSGNDGAASGGRGGGRTAVRIGSTEIATAGGGGGGSYNNSDTSKNPGFNGGGLIALGGTDPQGGGGTQTTGGSAGDGSQRDGEAGAQYEGGTGSITGSGYGGAGGGGGWYGGGGGGGLGGHHGAGGGGSGFAGRDGSTVLSGNEHGSTSAYADTTQRSDSVNNCKYKNVKVLRAGGSAGQVGASGTINHGVAEITFAFGFTHDGYNKLSISSITPTSSTLKYGSNTYDIGTATNIYIEDAGTYNLETKNANTFVLASNVNSSVTQFEPIITGGRRSAHALTYDGKLYGWGENSNGELGVGDSTDKTVPTLCTGIPQGEVASIWEQNKRGESRWAKTKDGRIWVTGDHDNYNLPGSSGDFTTFTDVSAEFGDYTLTSNNVVWASGGERATHVLMENGDVWSFGDDSGSAGILGQGGSPTNDRTPRKVTGISNVTKMASGGDLVMALDSSGNVFMWGRNESGNSAAGWGPYNTPTNIMGVGTADLTDLLAVDSETVTDIYCSYYSMFVLTNKGTVYGTGKNGSGQLGQGNTTAKTSSDGWVKIDYFTSNTITVNRLYVGGAQGHVFADTSDGYYCWGKNGSGNLALGDTTMKKTPVKWTNVSNIKKFGTGSDTLFAIAEDGKYYAWGEGSNDERGDATSSDISYPKYIDGLPNILAPSFEFDGYDKVFVNSNGLYKYTFELQIQHNTSGIEIQEIYAYDSGNNQITITNVTNGDATFSGSLGPENAYDGNTGTFYTMLDSGNTWSVGKKLFTVTTNSLVYKFGIIHARPSFKPGYNIKYDDTSIFTDTSNGGSSSSPQGATTDYILSSHGTETETTKYTKGTTTYDVGKASLVTVSDSGTYDTELSQGGVFALKSTTVPATKTTGLYTWAFHHGNFDNAYGDGDILTARDNGRFYADTPAYTSASIGTITPGTSSSFVYEFYVSVLVGSSGANNELWLHEISTTPGITSSMMVMNTQYKVNGTDYSAGTSVVGGLFDGSTGATDRVGVYPGYHNLNQKIFTLTTTTALTNITLVSQRPMYMPGWKIVLNGTTILEDSANNGTSGTPEPFTVSKTLPVNINTTYTFAPPSGGLTANVLMVAGGGGGGGRAAGGGGGAGGLVYTAGTSLASGATKTIVVGNGDSGGYGETAQNGYDGKDTTFTGLTTADGGGGGGNSTDGTGVAGGSGGGGGGSGSGGAAASGSQGTAGGASSSASYGGGGGGAGAAGSDYSGDYAGDGGTGKFFGTGSSFTDFGDEYGEGGWFAGGGAGGSNGAAGKFGGTPNRGGGGYGGNYYGYMGVQDEQHGGSQHALPHTGSGGGGSGSVTRHQHSGYNAVGNGGVKGHGGRGGSGIVLIQTNVAPPNGANTAVVQVGNPRRRSLPPAVSYMGSKVNRFYIIDSASMPTYKLPTHWYAEPPSKNSNHVPVAQGSHSLQKRADGGTSNVWYASSYQYFSDYGSYMAQSADAVFMPVVQQRYDVLLSIGANGQHDIQLEMAADGTAKLYRNNGATLLQAGTIKCFTVGKWHHIALTVDSEHNAIGYVNGHPVVSTTYTSNPDVGSRTGNMHFRTGVTATFRKFLTYEVSTYNFHMSPKQVLQRAAEVGLGPKLEYDGLNTLTVVNTERGSSVTIYESNVHDTSNIYAVSCDSSYTLSNAATYYAEIKGTDTYTITRPLTVTDDHFPLYSYPPRDGTQGSITNTNTADDWNTWTVSGATYGNGQYQARTNRTAANTRDAHAAFSNEITAGTGEFQVTHGGSTHYTGTLDLQLPSAKTIRKYVIWTTDSAFYKHNSTTYTDYDPTLPYNGSERNKRRIKSWTIQGSNNDSDWTTIHTVTNKPPSIYGDVHTISSPGSYQYYRLSWSLNNGSTQTTCIAELIYYGD